MHNHFSNRSEQYKLMGSIKIESLGFFIAFVYLAFCFIHGNSANGYDPNMKAYLSVDTSSGKPISDTLTGVFFEEINHAGAGGLWSELVSNRGFEAGGSAVPSYIGPWSVIGNETTLAVLTDRSSCFERNKMALRMEVLCGEGAEISCPPGGVGVTNPGFWGMNIVEGKGYEIAFYVRSLESISLTVAFTDSSSLQILASKEISVAAPDALNWTKVEFQIEAQSSSVNGSLQLTTSKKGVIWLDQVSAMPLDTYKGHGFRPDLFQMIADIKPRFIRFPGGCYVEGEWLRNAFRWKETVGPWENRPGHFGDVWKYWTDDGLGFYELLLLAEDLGALPIWVFNNGISHQEQVEPSSILPFVQEALDGIEFAIGDANSTWGSVRAAMGHPAPFDMRYVTIGNEDCGKQYYEGNYIKFYKAIKNAHPNMKIISNCDLTTNPLKHPADYFEYHRYNSAGDFFSFAHQFDKISRDGPKGFASEYAVHGSDAGNGNLLAAVAEAAFLIGIERNSDLVEMASYAPLLQHARGSSWKPNAIVFDSSKVYGTPSYWMQQFFIDSNGATLLNTTLQINSSYLEASAISWTAPNSTEIHIKIKVVNFSSKETSLSITINGMETNVLSGTMTVLKSSNKLDENSFQQPEKVAPSTSSLSNAGKKMDIYLSPYSLTAVDLVTNSNVIRLPKINSISRSPSK